MVFSQFSEDWMQQKHMSMRKEVWTISLSRLKYTQGKILKRSKYSLKHGEVARSEFVDEATQREGLERGQENSLRILTSGLQKLGLRTF